MASNACGCHMLDKLHNMAKRPELCALFGLMLLALLYKLCKSTPNVFRDHPLPRRFFPMYSVVTDFPRGNLDDVADLLEREELIVVMYYAPWCARSMWARQEFEKAANYLLHEIRFVAINCWYEFGSCKKSNNFISFPTIYIYHTTLSGFRYDGVLYGEYIVHYVHQMMSPYVHLNTINDLTLFMANTDNTVVGFFEFNSSPQPPGFIQFYYAAMRTITLDPVNSVSFGVVTNRHLAATLNIRYPDTVILTKTLNTTLQYPSPTRNSTKLVNWISYHRTQNVVHWLVPKGDKSLQLSTELDKGAAFVLFTPKTPLMTLNEHVHIVRELSLTYNDCNSTTKLNNIIQASVYHRWQFLRDTLSWLQGCQDADISEMLSPPASPSVDTLHCHSVCIGSATRFNSCAICQSDHTRSDCASSLPTFDPTIGSCRRIAVTYNPSDFASVCCGSTDNEVRRMSHPTFDPHIREAKTRQKLLRCRYLHIQREYKWFRLSNIPLGSSYHSAAMASLHGEVCRTARNRTLRFYAMDSRQANSVFLTNMGVSFESGKTIAVIIDSQREVHHVQFDEFNVDSLARFIHNYTLGNLAAHHKSGVIRNKPCLDGHSDVCIAEVTAATFQQIVLDNNKDVVLLYYAPWCGFCKRFAHIYLSLARYFRLSKGVVFARINGEENDLPWQYTMSSYPHITMFPARRKADSVGFPSSEKPLRLSSLIQFVLRHISSARHIRLTGAICSPVCLESNRRVTATLIRRLKRQLLRNKQAIVQRRLTSAKQLMSALTRAKEGDWRSLVAILNSVADEQSRHLGHRRT